MRNKQIDIEFQIITNNTYSCCCAWFHQYDKANFGFFALFSRLQSHIETTSLSEDFACSSPHWRGDTKHIQTVESTNIRRNCITQLDTTSNKQSTTTTNNAACHLRIIVSNITVLSILSNEKPEAKKKKVRSPTTQSKTQWERFFCVATRRHFFP